MTTAYGRRLLNAAAVGDLRRDERGDDWLVYGDPICDKVTRQVAKLQAAGLIVLATTRGRAPWVHRWLLTDAGEACRG